MEQSDDLRRWRLFATVAKTGSISSACTIFQTDAANLSRQLAQFEKSLGAGLLLDRSVRPLVLTENGKAAFECALKMLQLRDELTQNLKCDPNALSGVVRVGLPPMVLRDLLTPFLVSFSEAYPDIDLRVDEYTGGLPINFENWRGDLFDLVVSYGPSPSNHNAVQIRYGQGLFLSCASPSYLRRFGIPKTPEDLADHVGIVVANGLRQAAPALVKDGWSVPIHFKRLIHFNSASAAKTAALLGSGIHVTLPSLHCYREVRDGTLVPLLRGWEQPSLPLYIYSRPECVKLARVRLFVRLFREVMFDFLHQCAEVLDPWVTDASKDILRPVPLNADEAML